VKIPFGANTFEIWVIYPWFLISKQLSMHVEKYSRLVGATSATRVAPVARRRLP
jgi:hypothetical protein